jgi:hypothetical protein
MRKYIITGAIAFCIGAIVGCSNTTSPPERVKFESSISAVKCSNNFYSLKATWNLPVNTKWQALFRSVADTAKEDSQLSTVSPKVSSCKFSLNKKAFAILDNKAVVSDNDMTEVILVK